MKVRIVRLSRPLLIRTSTFADDNTFETIYGFVIKKWRKYNAPSIDKYVGYLAGMHFWSSGEDDFSIDHKFTGKPDWVDKQGAVHTTYDDWMREITNKCREKLNLTYDSFILDIDKEDLDKYIDRDCSIVSEDFYYDLLQFVDDEGVCERLDSDDELPF